MRVLAAAILCSLAFLGPAVAGADEKEAPKKPAGEMTEAERGAALLKARWLNEQCLALCRVGQYRRALDVAREVLAIREAVLGPEHGDVASALNNVASVLDSLGSFEEARPLYERAIAVWEKVRGPEDPEVALVLCNLAAMLEVQGKYEEALSLGERALRIREKARGAAHPDVALSLNQLATVLQEQGRYEEARPLSERALSIWETSLGPEDPQVARGLNTLAAQLFGLGAYEQARSLYERALAIRERVLPPDHVDVATSLENLATLLATIGASEEAMLLCKRALTIREKALGPDHADVGTSLNNLACVLVAQGKVAESRPLYERAIGIQKKTLGGDHPLMALSLNNLAFVLHALGATREAVPLCERALEIRKDALGDEHPDVGRSMNNLASLHEARGDHEKALALYVKAHEILEGALGAEHQDVARTLNNAASMLALLGRDEKAAEVLATCLRTVEAIVHRSVAGLQASERHALRRLLRGYLHRWLTLVPRLGRSGFAEVLRFKGILTRVAAAERRVARHADAKTRERVVALRAAERRLARLANAVPPFFDKQRRPAWQAAYAKAGARRDRLLLALQRDLAPLREGLERLGLSLSDIQARLGGDEALLEFLESGDEYLAWVVRATGEPKRFRLGKADDVQAAAEAFAQAAAGAGDEAWREAGARLRDLVFAPLARHLGKGVGTLYLCPDGALAAVPFAALPASAGGLLIDDYRMSNLTMAQDLVPWPDAPAPGEGALVLGGVDYGGASAEATAPAPEAASDDRAPRGGRFAYLPGTKAEVEVIRSRLGKGTTALLGRAATEGRVRALSRGRRVLHLATHGFVRSDLLGGLREREVGTRWLGADQERQLVAGHDPMVLAGLALAGANPRSGGGEDDGILTALEASHLDLRGVRLVMLSACETALGRAESGEGVIGLVQGFQMAGAGPVIGSLWQVDDEATRALMVNFYALWQPSAGNGLGAAAALRAAQAHVRSQPRWKHPSYWAAWVLWDRR